MAKKPESNEDQMALFEAAKSDLPLRAPYASGSDTSREAAESIEPASGTLRARVLGMIRDKGPLGMTCDEIEAESGLTHQTASARVNELMRLGAIVDSKMRRKTRSHRNAAVWLDKLFADHGEGHQSH